MIEGGKAETVVDEKRAIALQEAAQGRDSVVAEMPWVKPYRYVKFGEKIVLVDANLRYVAAIIE